MYKEVFDYTGPLSALIYKGMNIFFGRSRWVHWILTLLVIIYQAGLFNSILLRNKAFNDNNYLPAFFYVICMISIPDLFVLSPQLMSLTFVLLSLTNIFRRIDNEVTDELFLYSGILLGLATLFYLPAAIFFLIFLLSFIFFSSAIFRRLLLFIYGVLLVFMMVWSYFFWFDAHQEYISEFFGAGFLMPREMVLPWKQLTLGLAPLMLCLLLGITALINQRFTNFQQKMQQVMMFFMIGGIVVVLTSREVMVADSLFLVPSVVFFLTYYFLGLKRRWTQFVMPWFIVLAMLIYPYFWVQENAHILEVAPSKRDFKGEKIMGLGIPLSDYLDNQISGPFLNDYLSEKALNNLNFYDEAPRLYDLMNKSNPDVIIDQFGVWPDITKRFPAFTNQYRSSGAGVYKKISN